MNRLGRDNAKAVGEQLVHVPAVRHDAALRCHIFGHVFPELPGPSFGYMNFSISDVSVPFCEISPAGFFAERLLQKMRDRAS